VELQIEQKRFIYLTHNTLSLMTTLHPTANTFVKHEQGTKRNEQKNCNFFIIRKEVKFRCKIDNHRFRFTHKFGNDVGLEFVSLGGFMIAITCFSNDVSSDLNFPRNSKLFMLLWSQVDTSLCKLADIEPRISMIFSCYKVKRES
jgi:hypothetical protein